MFKRDTVRDLEVLMSDRRATLSNSRHIWFVNHHAVIPSKDLSAGRHIHLAKHLLAYGWSASIIVASTVHPSGRQAMPGARLRRRTLEDSVPVLWVRSLPYRSMLMRFAGMCFFALALLAPGMTRGLKRPDIIVGSTVHPLAAWAGLALSRRYKVPFIYEVRDVWPETLENLGSISAQSVPARLMRYMDRHLTHSSALVLSPLPKLDHHLEEMGLSQKRFLWIPNGYSGESVEIPEAPASQYTGGDFEFAYLGSHGRANALKDILDAFDLAYDAFPPDREVSLTLVGDGTEKRRLRRYAQTLGAATAIHFEDRIPEHLAMERARRANCLVVALPDLPVYRFGVSLNKFFMYLASGRPIIAASSAPNDPVSECSAGIAVRSQDATALAQAMIQMSAKTPTELWQMGVNGQRGLLARYGYGSLAAQLARELDSIMASK